MIDEDAVSVFISTDVVFHVKSPREVDANYKHRNITQHGKDHSHAAIHSLCTRSTTMYTIVIRNLINGNKFIVKRRYSEFYMLRKQLLDMISWKHCVNCSQYARVIASYPFPRRRFLRSNRSNIVKERMDSLGLFIRHLLLCLLADAFAKCKQASANIEQQLLVSFLRIDSKESFNSARQIDGVHVTFDNEQGEPTLRQPIDYASHSLAVNKVQRRKYSNVRVATDTCDKCTQKWTECYCNEDGLNLMSAKERYLPYLNSMEASLKSQTEFTGLRKCDSQFGLELAEGGDSKLDQEFHTSDEVDMNASDDELVLVRNCKQDEKDEC